MKKALVVEKNKIDVNATKEAKGDYPKKRFCSVGVEVKTITGRTRRDMWCLGRITIKPQSKCDAICVVGLDIMRRVVGEY